MFLCLFAEIIIPELTIYWQQSYYSASEADNSIEVCAELSTLEFTGSVEVDYSTVGSSAKGLLLKGTIQQLCAIDST